MIGAILSPELTWSFNLLIISKTSHIFTFKQLLVFVIEKSDDLKTFSIFLFFFTDVFVCM